MNDLDTYDAGEIQPYSPSQPLAPAPEWSGDTQLAPREHTYQRQPQEGQTIFGQPLPPGVSFGQAVEAYRQLGDVFVSDFMRLGHGVTNSQRAVAWFMDALSNPPQKQRKLHSYNLYQHSNDHIFQAFANYASANNFSARFVSDACWWVTEASKLLAKLDTKKFAVSQQPRMAPNQNVEAFYASLSDAEYKRLVDINNKAWCRTLQVLQDRWGDYTFQINMQVATDYLNSLPVQEQRLFNVMSKGGIELANTVEFWTHMFDAATGAHNIPKDGAGIAREIAECERCMKTNREQWLADNQLQARYRTLLQMQMKG